MRAVSPHARPFGVFVRQQRGGGGGSKNGTEAVSNVESQSSACPIAINYFSGTKSVRSAVGDYDSPETPPGVAAWPLNITGKITGTTACCWLRVPPEKRHNKSSSSARHRRGHDRNDAFRGSKKIGEISTLGAVSLKNTVKNKTKHTILVQN